MQADCSACHALSQTAHDPAAIEGLFVTVFYTAFMEVHQTPPEEIILDIDATDDPLHGDQGVGWSMTITIATAICRCTCSAAAICWPSGLQPANIDATAGNCPRQSRFVYLGMAAPQQKWFCPTA